MEAGSLSWTGLALRRQLRAAERLEWMQSACPVIHYRRPGGWEVVTNFGEEDAPLPPGEVVLATRPVAGSRLPGETTVWLRREA